MPLLLYGREIRIFRLERDCRQQGLSLRIRGFFLHSYKLMRGDECYVVQNGTMAGQTRSNGRVMSRISYFRCSGPIIRI